METVNIIGGGIGGLTLANALHREGIDFNLFEQAPLLTEIGAAIGLSRTAQTILEAFELEQQATGVGHIIKQLHFSDKDLNVIRAISPQHPTLIIHRAKLINILCSRLPKEKILLNKKLILLKSEANFSILRFSDGQELRSGCTVVADGIHSGVRKQLFPKIKVRNANQVIWRGITPLPIPKKYSNTYTEIWDASKRFLFTPMNNDSIFWLAILKAKAGGHDDPDTVRYDLLSKYKCFNPFLKELLEKSSNFIRTDLADLGAEKRKWYHNRVIFLGDSIHATTPNLAQGACQAMEDAFCLAHLLKNSKKDLSEIVETYQKLRDDKVSFIVKTSWQFGKLAHSSLFSPFAKFAFKHAPENSFLNLEKKLNDLSYLNRISEPLSFT
jgi:2-polyprenyl-6-methoxyphenol hydroxylase-like FAD-dependent oxidoreductase